MLAGLWVELLREKQQNPVDKRKEEENQNEGPRVWERRAREWEGVRNTGSSAELEP